MNLIEYLRLWWKTGECPPREVFLIDTSRQPTAAEIEYGKTLEPLARRTLNEADTATSVAKDGILQDPQAA